MIKLKETLSSLPDAFRKEAQQDLDELNSYSTFTSPLLLKSALEAFWAIRNTKNIEDAINCTDILHYGELFKQTLSPHDASVILRLDKVYRSSYYEVK